MYMIWYFTDLVRTVYQWCNVTVRNGIRTRGGWYYTIRGKDTV